MLYEVYNVPQAYLDSPPAPRVYLLLDKTPLESPPFQGHEAIPQRQRGEIRYVAKLLTAELRPGSYVLAVALPDGNNAIYKQFELVDSAK